jgi:hypothetical protein
MPRAQNAHRPKYFWPASAITPDDMALLHAVREGSRPRTPISELIASAIRNQYGAADLPTPSIQPEPQAPYRKAA